MHSPIQRVTLKTGREKSIYYKHHWIFSGAIYRIQGKYIEGLNSSNAPKSEPPEEGDLVEIKSQDNKPLGYGFYGTQSIAVRVISFNKDPRDAGFIENLLDDALNLRKSLNLLISESTNCCRLFHSEGDLFPGLTIDKFNRNLVIQIHNKGVHLFLDRIVNQLKLRLPETEAIILRDNSDKAEDQKGEVIFGEIKSSSVKENNISFEVDLINGQKTGFFLDQRDSRNYLGEISKDRSVLNLFCYTGGFSLYALQNVASKIISVDSSESATAMLDKNIQKLAKELNIKANHQTITSDCREFLKNNDEQFDIVVLDPPALVKKRQALSKGLSYYSLLQNLALPKVKQGGFLLSFSCSQFVTEEMLIAEISKAARQQNKNIKIVKRFTQAPCHPVNPNHPESLYLKGVMVEVIST